MNYAVELLGCTALSPVEQRWVVRRFRVRLARNLGGAKNVSTFLAAFEVAASDDVDRQTNAVKEAALIYSAAHHMATNFAFADRQAPEGAIFEVWPAH